MCSNLSAPLNGSITFVVDTTPTFDFMTAAMYKCDSGFALSGGDEVRICEEGPIVGMGEWSGTEPTCDRKIHTINKAYSLAQFVSVCSFSFA